MVAIVSDEFKSDEMTSEWEMKLSEIAKGKLAKNKFIEEIKKLIQETVDIYDKVGK